MYHDDTQKNERTNGVSRFVAVDFVGGRRRRRRRKGEGDSTTVEHQVYVLHVCMHGEGVISTLFRWCAWCNTTDRLQLLKTFV